jgi:2-methylcitrate dehydratase
MNDNGNAKTDLLVQPLGRRDLIKKLGVGAVATALTGKLAAAQQDGGAGSRILPPAPPPGSAPSDAWRPHTGPGFQNTYSRFGQNGQMDDTTQKIVSYVANFKESDMTPSVIKAVNRTMVDSMASIFAGFEEEAVRVAVRAARLSPAGQFKSTVLGYGITSTPELATFANSCMVRLVDFNDGAAGGHDSNLIPAALAMGEALHSTGSQVMAAITVGYEIMGVPGAGESVGPAMAVGKLMGLDEDHLANAVTLALTPHIALNKGVGAMSMWKGCRSAEAVKCGVWAAILAQQGMTGPPQPFEGRGGLWYSEGRMGRPFNLPDQAKLVIERSVNKRFPSDQMTQQTLALIPQIRAWTKPEEIASIEYYMPFGDWEEVGDAAKWDPRNRDTADHSIPYVLTRNIISGESYLDAFSLDKLPFRDPVAKELINKIALAPVAEWRGNGTARIVIRKKSGEEKYWDTHNGSRDPGGMDAFPQMSDDDITAKFKRAAAYRHIDEAQRDRALAAWWNLTAVKDIGEPLRDLAKFGNPLPL